MFLFFFFPPPHLLLFHLLPPPSFSSCPAAPFFLFLIVNSARSFRRLTTAVTRSYLAEISAVETLWFSTNAKTERLRGHGKRAGIKRKIKRRITLFHIYRMWTRTRRGGTTASFSNIHGSIFFFLFFLLHFYFREFLSSDLERWAIEKEGKGDKFESIRTHIHFP